MIKSNYPAKIKWLLSEKLAKASIPDYTDLISWRGEGITSVVNLLEDSFEDIVKDEEDVGFNVLHLPVNDFTAPTLEQLKEIVNWINAEIAAEGKVVVHCYAGIGRTSTVLIAYLINSGMDLHSAMNKVMSVGSSPQSDVQIEVVKAYYEKML